MKRVLGAVLFGVPVLALVAASAYVNGLWVTVFIWTTAIVLTAMIATGIKLLVD